LALQDPAMVEAQAAAASAEEAPAKAGAEMLGVKRSDWKNSRKAINDILKELADKVITESRARVELDSIGVPPDKVNVYIEDALDGVVSNPVAAAKPISTKPRNKPASKVMHTHIHVPPPVAAAPISITNEIQPQQPPVVHVAPPNVTVTPAVVHVAAPNVTIEKSEPPVVHVTNDVQPAAVNVNLPTRKTTTTVFRDKNGAILGSEQIEKDAE
jgi:phage tail sheath protein FI